jgi:hypothetical protein
VPVGAGRLEDALEHGNVLAQRVVAATGDVRGGEPLADHRGVIFGSGVEPK